MLKDLRHAVRMLLHAKGWTAVVILSLALGIGANTAIFSGVNALLLTEIPVRIPTRWCGCAGAAATTWSPARATTASRTRASDGQNVRTTFSYPMYQQFVADNQTMTDLFACAPFGRVNVVVDGQAEIASAFISTGNYYQVLGVTRAYRPDDSARGRQADRAAGGGDQLEVLAHALRHRSGRRRQDDACQQRAGHDRRRAAAGLHRRAAAGRRSRRTSACRWRSIPQLDTVHRHRAAPGAADLLVAAGDGTAEAGRDRAAGAGQSRGRVPEHRARRARLLSEGADRSGPRHGRRNRNRTEVPHLLVDSARRGIYDVNTDRRAHRDDPQRRGRAGAADRLRQRRQPAAVARDDAAEGAVGAAVARRDARPAGPAAADREPAARVRRRRARHPGRLLGQTAAAAAGNQSALLDWRVLAFVLGVDHASPASSSASRRRCAPPASTSATR